MALTVVDQGASSISNFALSIVVAHYSSASALGVFAVLTSSYVLSQGLVRSLTSDCLLTRSETDERVMRPYEQGGYLTAILLSVALAVVLAAIGLALPGKFTLPFVVFAVSFPLMACQDYARFIGIKSYDPGYAIRLDVAWLIIFLVAYAILRRSGLISLPWTFGAWSGAGALVGFYTLRRHFPRTEIRRLLRFWDQSERAVGVRFAGQFLLGTSWTYFIFYLLLFVLTLSNLGEFKLSQLALGPITVVAAGVSAAMIAVAARRFQTNKNRAIQFLLAGGVATAGLTLAWTALVYLAPVHDMTKIFGHAWPGARSIVPLGGLAFALASVFGAATAGLRAMRAARENLYLSIVMLPFLVGLCMGGAILDGARGGAGGLSVGFAAYSVLAWWWLLRVAHRFTPGADAASDEVEVRAVAIVPVVPVVPSVGPIPEAVIRAVSVTPMFTI